MAVRDALEYHEATKHHFNRFARSRGRLDWATQPNPFRRHDGAPLHDLPRDPVAADVPYACLFDGTAPRQPLTEPAVADALRCAVGLSAWKRYESTRWPLRVNPSSGNLHPTETYVVLNGRVYHYAVKEHALEERGVLPASAADRTAVLPAEQFLIGLTSIHWREAWKYGERAFRYCQHDIGHAIGAVRISAARLGWRVRLLTAVSDADIETLLGLDRDEDFADAEREAPECLLLVDAAAPAADEGTGLAGSLRPVRGDTALRPARRDTAVDVAVDLAGLLAAARQGRWQGRANRLSPGHVDWPIIDEVAALTRSPGIPAASASPTSRSASAAIAGSAGRAGSAGPVSPAGPPPHAGGPPARQILLQRRSAVAFDGRSTISKAALLSMLSRLVPGAPPWDVIDGPAEVHLVLFVHRVDGLTPGVYAFLRDSAVRTEWQQAMRAEFMWEPAAGPADQHLDDRLFLLVPTDVVWPATRISCDQDIAGQGFFSLAMVARLGPRVVAEPWLYRHRFWEAGLVGQVLYLEAEAAGARSTGIGCFYDDPVHELLGLTAAATGGAWQSLYHFSMGMPVEDTRLTTEPGYAWEVASR